MRELKKFFKGKKVLITGHTGFKGSWLSQILVLWGAEVSGISLKPSTKPNLYSVLKLKNKVSSNIVDIRDFKKVKRIFEKEKPEIVFHLAAQPIVRESYDNPLYTLQTNILGTAHVLEVIRLTKSVRATVMITTDKVYEDSHTARAYKEEDRLGGHDPYSSSKAAAELVIASYRKSFFPPETYGQDHPTLIASVRAGNVIGGGDWSKDRIVPDLVRAVFETNQPLLVRNPKAVRPWQHVLQPLFGYLLTAQHLYNGDKNASRPWNFGPGMESQITVGTMLEHSLKHLGKGTLTFSPDIKKHEALLLSLDSSKARRQLGWRRSFTVKDTIAWTLDWYQSYYMGKDMVKITKDQIKSFFTYEL